MLKHYRYRIYPHPHQKQSLARAFGCARVVWNDALDVSRKPAVWSTIFRTKLMSFLHNLVYAVLAVLNHPNTLDVAWDWAASQNVVDKHEHCLIGTANDLAVKWLSWSGQEQEMMAIVAEDMNFHRLVKLLQNNDVAQLNESYF